MDDLSALRDEYPPFVIVHAPGTPWYALPIWSLNTRLDAATADQLRERMDRLLKAVPPCAVKPSGAATSDTDLPRAKPTGWAPRTDDGRQATRALEQWAVLNATAT
jgi:hypothetical protein